MNCVYPTNAAYITTEKILNATPLSADAIARREYIKKYKFSVKIDSNTQKCQLVVTKKHKEEWKKNPINSLDVFWGDICDKLYVLKR